MNDFTFLGDSFSRRSGPSNPRGPIGSRRSGPGRSPSPSRPPRSGSPGPSLPLDDFPADISTTAVLEPGVALTGSIEVGNDRDWFKKVLQAGTTYRFSLDGLTLSDPILALRDSNGLLIQENDDKLPGSNLNSQITFTPSLSGTYYLDVRSFGGATGTYQLTAEELNEAPAAPVPSSGFDIEIDYSGDPAFLGFFTEAAGRWSQIITADLPDFAGVDDLLISVTIADIDGVGGVLGQAGPDVLRPSSLGGLPYAGSTNLDAADVANLASKGTLDDVVLHEFGHILGIGTIWDIKGLRSGTNYTGVNASREYNLLGGSGSTVPLESNGGSGTALSHWSEDVFGDELMTGFLSGSTNPLSKVTVGTLQDLGYSVNYSAADFFSLPTSLVGPDLTSLTPTIDRLTRPRPSVVSDEADILVDGSTPCFCGTCASLAQTGFELRQFSASVVPSQLPSPDGQASKLKAVDPIVLPAYLATNVVSIPEVAQESPFLMPSFMETDQIAT